MAQGSEHTFSLCVFVSLRCALRAPSETAHSHRCFCFRCWLCRHTREPSYVSVCVCCVCVCVHHHKHRITSLRWYRASVQSSGSRVSNDAEHLRRHVDRLPPAGDLQCWPVLLDEHMVPDDMLQTRRIPVQHMQINVQWYIGSNHIVIIITINGPRPAEQT